MFDIGKDTSLKQVDFAEFDQASSYWENRFSNPRANCFLGLITKVPEPIEPEHVVNWAGRSEHFRSLSYFHRGEIHDGWRKLIDYFDLADHSDEVCEDVFEEDRILDGSTLEVKLHHAKFPGYLNKKLGEINAVEFRYSRAPHGKLILFNINALRLKADEYVDTLAAFYLDPQIIQEMYPPLE